MSPIDHPDLFVTSLERSLDFALVHRPAESDLAAQVRQLTARPERREQQRDRA